MRCGTVQPQLDRFARQEISPQVRTAIETHLRECPECRADLARLERLAALLAETNAPPGVPEGFGDRLMAAARQRRASRPAPRSLSATLAEYAARAAVLAAGLLVGVAMGQQTWQSVHAAGMRQTCPGDSLANYAMDSMSDAPGGSLAESYLALTTTSNDAGD